MPGRSVIRKHIRFFGSVQGVGFRYRARHAADAVGATGWVHNEYDGTVTMEIGNAVKEVKAGKIDFKVDKTGIIHAGIGKVSFSADQIRENAAAMIDAINKLKPQTLKGTYMKAASICSTMSPGIKIDIKAYLNGAEK